MGDIIQNICPKCKKWLNRPAQINIILEHKGKVLVLNKNPKQLKDPSIGVFFKDFLSESFPNVDSTGWNDLPGGDVRPEHTIEDAIHDRLRTELGMTGEIKSLVGIYDDRDRDPRTSGISFCFVVTTHTDKVTLNKDRVDRVEWVNKKWMLKNHLYSDHQDMLKDYFDNVSLETKKALDMSKYAPRPLGSYSPENRCEVCGQYRNRPIQADGILEVDEAVLLIKRKPEEPKSDMELDQWYKYGKYSLPGGYVDRGEKADKAIIREYKEETGLDVKVVGVVGVYSEIDRDPKSQGVSICYQLELANGHEVNKGHFEWRGISDENEDLAFDHKEMVQDYYK